MVRIMASRSGKGDERPGFGYDESGCLERRHRQMRPVRIPDPLDKGNAAINAVAISSDGDVPRTCRRNNGRDHRIWRAVRARRLDQQR